MSYNYSNELVEDVAHRIQNKFNTSWEKSLKLSRQIIEAYDDRGGNPRVKDEMDSLIDVVVRAWIKSDEEKSLKEKKEN